MDFENTVIAEQANTASINSVLLLAGISPTVKGFEYLRAAILLTMKNPAIVYSITKSLYPDIAKAFNTSPAAIERCMRYAVEDGWERCDTLLARQVFKNSIKGKKGKPTVGQFISCIAGALDRSSSLTDN